ncbi:polysaccharide deacetylase family protein, partial [Leptospira santarosai]
MQIKLFPVRFKMFISFYPKTPNGVMRNIFVIFSLLDLFIFSTLIASPVNDFLNPEKRRKPTASS